MLGRRIWTWRTAPEPAAEDFVMTMALLAALFTSAAPKAVPVTLEVSLLMAT